MPLAQADSSERKRCTSKTSTSLGLVVMRRFCICWALTFKVTDGRQWAKPAVGRPVHRGVRPGPEEHRPWTDCGALRDLASKRVKTEQSRLRICVGTWLRVGFCRATV